MPAVIVGLDAAQRTRLAQSATTAVSIGVTFAWGLSDAELLVLRQRKKDFANRSPAINEKFMLLSRTVKLHVSYCAKC
jgi:hypothetical protein